MTALVDSTELARAAAIDPRAARKAIDGAREGRLWRGNLLSVVKVRGRNMVLADSLPADLREVLGRSETAVQAPLKNC